MHHYILLTIAILCLISGLLTLAYKIVFLRNPARQIPSTDGILSPADGKIIAVTTYANNQLHLSKGNKGYKGVIKTTTKSVDSQGYVISIFMNLHNVHYNRVPCTGVVKEVSHSNGRFKPANSLLASLENEKTETLIRGPKVTIKVIQVAGFIARRIETYVKPGQTVASGQILGRINLGSQATLILPRNVRITAKVGQKVKAGETILGYPI